MRVQEKRDRDRCAHWKLKPLALLHADQHALGVYIISRLGSVGFTDVQICDIALCTVFRCFVSRFFDVVGAGPEPALIDPDADVSRVMTVGKEI